MQIFWRLRNTTKMSQFSVNRLADGEAKTQTFGFTLVRFS